jgi:hypothetical protein
MGNHIKTFQEQRDDAAYKTLSTDDELYEEQDGVARKTNDHIENYYEYVDRVPRL